MKIKEFLSTIEGLSLNTRNAYEQTLWQLFNHMKGEEPTADEIYEFLHGYKASSLQRHKAAIKAYLEFTQPGVAWPFGRHQFPSSVEPPILFVDSGVIKKMENAADNKDDQMFILTLYTLGCRIHELMKIEEEDITPTGVNMITKGGNRNLSVILPQFYKTLKTYAKGKKGKLFPRTYNYYYLVIKKLAAQVGYPQMTPHWLRHSRVVSLLESGVELTKVAQIMHHKNINTTYRYSKVTGGGLVKELEKVETNNGQKTK